MSAATPAPRAPDGPGIRLARALFTQVVQPIVDAAFPALRYDAALIGAGSEVLGFDTERSEDHDFGARCQIFLADGDPAGAHVAATLDARLPDEFEGFPTRFVHTHESADGPPVSKVIVTSVPTWSRTALGRDVTAGLRPIDWLGMPWQLLAEATGGAVFHDGLGELATMRARIAWYPDDVWRYVLAGQFLRIAQEEAFVGRCGEVGDDLGSALVTARLIRDVMRLVMLQRRRYPPYSKWLGSAFRALDDAATLGPMFAGALQAADWQRRQSYLMQVYAYVARAQNTLGLAAEQDPEPRPFWSRPFVVMSAGRFADALRDAITDPALRALPLIGSVDQISDSVDVLSHADRAAALTRALYPASPHPE